MLTGGHALSIAQPIDRIPVTVLDDFETGELFAWEAYPYAQDIAFDALFFARDMPTYKNSNYSIARSVQANDSHELEHGFTKQLSLWTTVDTRVKCAIYFQSDRNPQSLELSLGTFDGKRYFHVIESPKANQWLEIDVPISEFFENGNTLVGGQHIQVATLKGAYTTVSYLHTYTILMDDFQMDGERQRRFLSVTPAAEVLNWFGFSVLDRHFFAGDEIAISTAPEGDIELVKVTGKLMDGKGDIVKSDIRFTYSNRRWTNESIYRVRESDNRGQWSIVLSGITSTGSSVTWEFRFLVPVKPVNNHPRLLFSNQELNDRLANELSPVARRILDNALAHTTFMDADVDAIHENVDRTEESLVGPVYAKDHAGYNAFGTWRDPMTKLGDIIQEGSFRYAFTGDTAAAKQAKRALLRLCSFTKWNNNWMLKRKFYTYYPVGYVLKSVAYGYDMLYDALTNDERKFVRNAIMDKGLKLFHRDMVEMNRMPSNQTNHIAVIVSGYGLAATAIYGDDNDNPYLEPYISGILAKTKCFMERTYYDDGSYAEPTGYMDMASRSLAEFLPALERSFGIDLTTSTDFGRFYEYPLYATYQNGLIQSYGDAIRTYSGFTQLHAQWLTYRTGNPYLYHYLKPYWKAGNGGYFGYLWYRDDIVPVTREGLLPASRDFKARGMVMRSGWDDTATVITTRVGPNSNHYHYDQGSFQVMANGEELLTDPGYGTAGYYANPEFLSYDIQAIAHNVMLVDHDPESQSPAHYDNGVVALRDWPRMTHVFNGKTVDAVESDLCSVYKGKLDAYSRTLLYNKGATLFLFDRVKSKSPNGEVYDWLFHAPKDGVGKPSIGVNGNRLTVERPRARLTMDVLYPPMADSRGIPSTPTIVSTTVRQRYDLKFPENFATFTSNEGVTEINFLAAIVPEARPSHGGFGNRPTTELVKTDVWMGAKVTRVDGIDYGFFRNNEANWADGVATVVSQFNVKARRFMASYDGDGKLAHIYLEGSMFSVADFSIQADQPTACAVAWSGNELELCVAAVAPTTLRMNHRRQPKELVLDDHKMRRTEWKYRSATGELAVKIPSGKHQLVIR